MSRTNAFAEDIGLTHFEKEKERKTPKWNEGKLQLAIVENAKAVFKKSVGVVQSEFWLYEPISLLQEEVDSFFAAENRKVKAQIGRIDLVLKYRSRYLVCEIKYKSHETDFWDALKVMGYKVYFEWQTNQKATPTIIMPKEKIRLEHKIVAGRLSIQLIGAILNADGTYSCEFVN